MCGKL